MKLLISFFLFECLSLTIHTQSFDTIHIKNPSFEDAPQCCKPPVEWIDCGFRGETPPDIQPAKDVNMKPYFNVKQSPYDGKTYIGMVVREHETYESVCQRLEQSIKKGKCYSGSIMICTSDSYLSASNRDNPTNLKEFTTPAILRIFGGNQACQIDQLLSKTDLIKNTQWQKFEYQFKAIDDMKFIQLQAFYDLNAKVAYNGNILLDNMSDLIEVDCDKIMNK